MVDYGSDTACNTSLLWCTRASFRGAVALDALENAIEICGDEMHCSGRNLIVEACCLGIVLVSAWQIHGLTESRRKRTARLGQDR